MKVINSKLTKQYSLLTITNFLVLIIAFVTNIVITRSLTETEYGAYRYVISTITMLVSFLNFGLYYSSARLLTKADSKKESKLYAGTIQLFIAIIFLAGLILYFGYQLVTMFVPITNRLFLYALPLVYTIMLQRTFIYMLKGSNRIFDVALQTILPHFVVLLLYILFDQLNVVEINLLISLIIYGLAYLFTNFITIYRLKIPVFNKSFIEIKEIFSEQKSTGAEIYKGSLLSVFSGDLLNVIVGSIVLKADYAVYTLALSLSAPLLQIPATMGIIQFKKNANVKKINSREIMLTLILTIVAYFVMNLGIQLLFPIVYNNSYHGTRQYILVISLGYVFHGLGDYFNHYLNARGMGRSIKYGAYLTGISHVILAIVFIPKLGIWGLVLSRIGSSILYFIVMIVSYYLVVNKNDEVW